MRCRHAPQQHAPQQQQDSSGITRDSAARGAPASFAEQRRCMALEFMLEFLPQTFRGHGGRSGHAALLQDAQDERETKRRHALVTMSVISIRLLVAWWCVCVSPGRGMLPEMPAPEHIVPRRMPAAWGLSRRSTLLLRGGAGDGDGDPGSDASAVERVQGGLSLMPRERDSENDEASSSGASADAWGEGLFSSGASVHTPQLGVGHELGGNQELEEGAGRGRPGTRTQMTGGPLELPRSGSPWTAWAQAAGAHRDANQSDLHVATREDTAGIADQLCRAQAFDYGPEEDFVLHLPPSVVDEIDPAKEPDPDGALDQGSPFDDNSFYGVSAAWQSTDNNADAVKDLLGRRRLRRQAWDSLVIPWNATDGELKDSIPKFVRLLKEVDPTIDREDVAQAIFKTIMCRQQIAHVIETGISVGYNNSMIATPFHAYNASRHQPALFAGPQRREELRRFLKNQRG